MEFISNETTSTSVLNEPPSFSLMQGAYLVGVSDANSHAGQKGLVDPAQFAKAKQSIQMACQNLVDPACTQSQVPFSINVPQLDCGMW